MLPVVKKLLSGNEALALGAYHAGVRVAAAYPGTPSTEIMENLSRFSGIHAEWSINEKVAMEVAMGASYTGARAMASMKHVGLNVASDPFMAAAATGVRGGLVVISADDPGMHSSQNEQDNRYYAKLGKVPLLEPSNSQEAYDFIRQAFKISEEYDTPVLFRTTTRVSHAKSVVRFDEEEPETPQKPLFRQDISKFVMLPVYARGRHPLALERLRKLAEFGETSGLNYEVAGNNDTGVISAGIAFQYSREALPGASFLKLGLSYPLPERRIREFAARFNKLVVIEELEPFLEEQLKAMGLAVAGKDYIPQTGELSTDIVRRAARDAGWGKPGENRQETPQPASSLPARPPLLCPGCPHAGLFFTLSSLGIRKPGAEDQPGLVITGDIGCYTLGAYPPLSAMDTCACMGAGLGQAQGMEWAGLSQKVVAVIGDSTFMHSGITGLINAVYNHSHATIIILDNSTTAMTGHQPHPGTGTTAAGEAGKKVELEHLIRGSGVTAVSTVDAFDLAAIRKAVKEAMEAPEVSVVIVRGPCAVISRRKTPRYEIDETSCNKCNICLKLGCPAIRKTRGILTIDKAQCTACGLCAQLCPRKSIIQLGGIDHG
jgi:indolepyruvate ferredoxin oxidoreductase, alpha subunit